MAIQDIIQKHFTPAETAQVATLFSQIETILRPKLQNLSPEENDRYGSIKEQNKLVVNKAKDYHDNQPAMSSPDVDWPEYDADHADRKFLESVQIRATQIGTGCEETKRCHDYDNYNNALLDYEYSKYKNGTTSGLGFDVKVAEYAQFFEQDSTPGA